MRPVEDVCTQLPFEGVLVSASRVTVQVWGGCFMRKGTPGVIVGIGEGRCSNLVFEGTCTVPVL